MNLRTALTILSLVACFSGVWAVLGQKQQLANLRAEQPAPSFSAGTATDAMAAGGKGQESTSDAVSQELLRLRSEVTQLTLRKRALAGVAEENERLRAQIQNTRTNSQGSVQMPPGYLRKIEARFAGYSTPENTFESFLWALRNHDVTACLNSLTPGTAQKLQERFQDPTQAAAFLRDMDAVPGFLVQNRKDQPDGSVQFEVEVVPGMPRENMRLQAINGEWKLDLPF